MSDYWIWVAVAVVVAELACGLVLVLDARRQDRRRAARLAQRAGLPFPFGGAR